MMMGMMDMSGGGNSTGGGYFTSGVQNFFLFQSFVPSTTAGYTGALVFVFVLTLAYVWLGRVKESVRKTLQKSLSAALSGVKAGKRGRHMVVVVAPAAHDSATSVVVKEDLPTAGTRKPEVGREEVAAIQRKAKQFHLLLSFLDTLLTTLSYALMLLVMSFNVGIFLTVIAGHFAGNLFFREYFDLTGVSSFSSSSSTSSFDLEDS